MRHFVFEPWEFKNRITDRNIGNVVLFCIEHEGESVALNLR